MYREIGVGLLVSFTALRSMGAPGYEAEGLGLYTDIWRARTALA